ncbi:MAG: SWIM zinc finger domain-containing protein [Desulfobulbaceae bacterium]|nr:SWIM zinc finger domain-containing protein [Desulfobulbaceae bacterium]
METISTILRDLTISDLNQWAGEKICGRGKIYIKRVERLRRTTEGELVARVLGSESYATLIRLDKAGQHKWFCTCPYDSGPCKHAVAVVLAAADRVKLHEAIPLIDEDDELYLDLFGEQEAEPSCTPLPEEPESDALAPPEKEKKAGRVSVSKLLAAKSREELLELVVDLAGRYPEVERLILETEQLRSGRIDPLVRSLCREIKKLSSEPAWYNHWKHEGNVPDYSHVEDQFKALLCQGHADSLLHLGEELRRRGTAQVEQSDDDGATGRAIADCLDVVLQAVPKSSLTHAQQLLWVIDRLLEDEFSLLESGEEALKNPVYTQEDWQEVATALEHRLASQARPRNAAFSDTYQRKKVINRLIQAYRQGGWLEKILPLLEEEADHCGNYEQLVEALLAAGKREQARQWCIRGFAQTRDNLRGIAAGLQKRLREIAGMEKRYDLVAAYRAQDFFEHPTLETYKELRRTAEKIGAWSIVQAAALEYLASGKRPDMMAKGSKPADWPLPEPEVGWPPVKERRGYRPFPNRETLIDIAIAEKRFDDAVSLFRGLQEKGRAGAHLEQAVAKAVAQTHPEVSLGIWRRLVDGLIAEVKPKAYIEAGGFLRLMHKVYEAGNRLTDWQALVAELRRTHKAKRRLLEVLDNLTNPGKKIIE